MHPPFYITVILLAGTFCNTGRLQAQDVLADKRALSAVQVSKEPRHHNVFENTWIRVLDVRIPPGDTSLFHKHSTPSVFIVLSNTKTGSEVVIEPAKIKLTYGNIWFEGFYDKPRIHRVWNSDTTQFHVMDIELLNRENVVADAPIESFVLLFDEKPVRGYRVTLKPQTTLGLKERRSPILVVNLGEAAGALVVNGKQLVHKGDFTFIAAGTGLAFENKREVSADLVMLELK